MTTSQFDKNVEAFKKVAVIMAALEELHNSPSSSPQNSDDVYIALIKSHGVTSQHDADGILDFWNKHGSAFVA